MTEPSFLLSFEPDGSGGFIVRDALARRYRVPDQRSLWALLGELSADPELPTVQVDQRNDMVGIVAGLARRVVPHHAELVDAAEPIAHHASALMPVIQKIRAARERGKR